MSLIEELKRRKVFKVGAAYLVVAWLAVQAASIAFPTFEAPVWALRVFIFVVMLGFPFALMVAWMLEVTPEGVKLDRAGTGDRRMLVIVALLALLATAWYFKGQPSYKKDDPQAAGPPTVAVLPFANLSGDQAQEFFSDGMTEEILNVLVKVPDLKVAARTSVFEFKGKGGDVREIGRKLGVTHIVEGSIRRDANTVRVTAQLIRVADGFHMWSETYDRELKSVFALQDEIAQRIAGQLKGSLAKSDAPVARAGIDPQAYDDYLKARKLYRARTRLPGAVAHLESAVARAPQFAQAWATLALVHEVVIWTTSPLARQAVGEALPRMREAAGKAEQLDPGAALTLHAVANVARGEGRYLDAEALYLRAIAVDPTYPDVREDYAELLTNVGRYDEGLKAARELVALEPLVPVFWNRISAIGIASGDRTLVDESSARMLEIAPDTEWGLTPRIDFALATGDTAGARAALEQAYRADPATMSEHWAIWRWSQRDPAIDDAIARHAVAVDIDFAPYALLRGDLDLFFESLALKRDRHAHIQTYVYLLTSGSPATLTDPRAKQMLRERGFEAYWRAKGWPAGCRALGDTDFECGR